MASLPIFCDIWCGDIWLNLVIFGSNLFSVDMLKCFVCLFVCLIDCLCWGEGGLDMKMTDECGPKSEVKNGPLLGLEMGRKHTLTNASK